MRLHHSGASTSPDRLKAAEAVDVNVIDLASGFAGEENPARLYEGHFSEEGAALVARVIADRTGLVITQN